MSDESRYPAEIIPELTSLIYDSVADSSRWTVFLEAFIGAVRGRRGTLAIHASGRGELGITCWSGWSDQDIRTYVKRYAAIDPWRIGFQLSEGSVAADFEFCPREKMESSVAFQEFYATRDSINGFGGIILVTGDARSAISIVRGAKDGPFGETEKAILRPLMPHLKRAALLHGEICSLRRQLAMFTHHLNRYSHAFLITDSEGQVLYTNASAREVLAMDDGLTTKNGCLTIASPRHNTAFRQAVAEVSSGYGAPLRRFLVSRPSHNTPYLLLLMPVEDSGMVSLGASLPAVSILIIDAALRTEPDVSALCELFSLTPAEARIAGSLAFGRSVEEIAAESRTSIETVRTHIKRVFSKTGTARQGALISLVLRSMPERRA